MKLVPKCNNCSSNLEPENCHFCGGCGEGYTSDSACSSCGGSGVTGELVCYNCDDHDEIIYNDYEEEY